jgi:hypothetical protein
MWIAPNRAHEEMRTMSKKHFIALADAIRNHNDYPGDPSLVKPFDRYHLNTIATCLQEQNPNFDRQRWLAYIAGECGPNGGKVKKAA